MDIPVGHTTPAASATVKAQRQRLRPEVSAPAAPSLIAVVAPSGSPNQDAAAAIAVQVEDVLRQSGVSPRAIDYRVYRAGSEERNAPVRIAYSRIAAQTAPCGPWPDQVADNGENRHYFNFGCATQQNLAAIVANPLDLLYPRGMTPADAAASRRRSRQVPQGRGLHRRLLAARPAAPSPRELAQ